MTVLHPKRTRTEPRRERPLRHRRMRKYSRLDGQSKPSNSAERRKVRTCHIFATEATQSARDLGGSTISSMERAPGLGESAIWRPKNAKTMFRAIKTPLPSPWSWHTEQKQRHQTIQTDRTPIGQSCLARLAQSLHSCGAAPQVGHS